MRLERKRGGAGCPLTLTLSRGEREFAVLAAFFLSFSCPVRAQERAIPFWPDEVPAAIHAQVNGNAALETVRELGRFHRVHGSPGLAAAAELVRKKLLAAGLSDAAVWHFSADGKTCSALFQS